MFNTKKFGEVIRFLRKRKGLSLLQYSMELNISEVYLGQIERGEKSPSVEVAVIILNSLNISVEESCNLLDTDEKLNKIELRNKIDLLNDSDCKYLYNLLTNYSIKSSNN